VRLDWWLNLLPPAVTVALLTVLGPFGFYLVLPGLVLWALLGPRHAIHALTLTWLVVMINPGLAEPPPSLATLRWLPILAASLSLLLRYLMVEVLPWAFWLLVAFCLLAGTTAWLSGVAPLLSNLRLLSFFLGLLPIVLAYRLCSQRESDALRDWFDAVLLFISIVSLPMLASPIGFLRNGYAFQGILNHPQGFGVVMGITLAWFGTRLLVEREHSISVALGSVLALPFVFLSLSRTGLVAFTLGVAIPCAAALVAKTAWARSIRGTALRPAVLAGIILAMVAVVAFRTDVGQTAADFLLKRENDSDFMTAVANARGAQVQAAIDNISMHPWIGIGYGVPSDLTAASIKYDPVLGLPISAPVEKGILYIAIVEELGILGTLLFAALVWTIIGPVFRSTSPSAVCLVCACLASNLGEASLLAFGGHGLLQWLLIGLASTATGRRTSPGR
jgi:hypothetical protein